MTGVDPSVFRRYFREEEEEQQEHEETEFSAGGYNRFRFMNISHNSVKLFSSLSGFLST